MHVVVGGIITCVCIFTRFLEAAESGEIGKNGIFTIEEAATKLGNCMCCMETTAY